MSGEKFSDMQLFKSYSQKRQTLIKIFRKIYGTDYPEETDPSGFVTLADLKNIVKYLEIRPGETLIELGCGTGGPGLWIAREKKSNYIGIDLSEKAIEIASQRIKNFKMENRAKFQKGDICATKFPDNFFDGAISIDVLHFVPDKLAVVNEVGRILRSDRLFVFTTYEKKRPSKINDIRIMLRNAGFEVKIYDEPIDWERRQLEFYQSVLNSKNILIKEMGDEDSRPWIEAAQNFMPVQKYMRRVLVVAKKF